MKSFHLDCFSLAATNSDCEPPAEAIASVARTLRAQSGFPAHQDKSIWQEAECQLLALQRRTQCSIGLAIHG